MADSGQDRKSSGRRRDDYSSDASEDDRRSQRKYDEREHSRKDRRERDAAGSSRHDRKYRERSRSRERSHHHRHRSRSPPSKRRRHSESTSKSPPPASKRNRAPLPSQNESFRGGDIATTTTTNSEGAPVEKQKPNYKPTGLLAKEANTVSGTTTVLKYHEPAEARKPPPKEPWRMYIFKQKDLLSTLHLHTRSAWLFGRDAHVTDHWLEHPSASKQHAVVQFRFRSERDEFGERREGVRPYLIDLESANGTFLNGARVGASRYVELRDGDVVGFGESEREYVMMLPPPEEKKKEKK